MMNFTNIFNLASKRQDNSIYNYQVLMSVENDDGSLNLESINLGVLTGELSIGTICENQ